MKGKCFFKVIALTITLSIISALILVPIIKAQIVTGNIYSSYLPIFSSWQQYQPLWKLSYPSIYLGQQNQNWLQYQSNLYQPLLNKPIFSTIQNWSSFVQPYSYQPYSQYLFKGINMSWPGGLLFTTGLTTFPYQSIYPLFPQISQRPPSQQKTTAQGTGRLIIDAINLSNVQTDNEFINNYSLGALDIRLKVSQYNLPLKTNEISNFADFSTKITLGNDALNLLKKNGFVVIHNPFNPKEEDIITPYKTLKDEEIPIFITSDTLLHLYHIQFDETLKQIEEREFYDKIWEISQEFFDDAIEKYSNTTGDLKEASKRNVAYLSVGLSLLQPREDQLCNLEECDDSELGGAYFTEEDLTNYSFLIPDFVESEVTQELDLIERHSGFEKSPIFIYLEDYSQYVPRGHYTRSERLKNYFKAFMWYGRISMLLKGSETISPGETCPFCEEALISTYDAMIQTIQACLTAKKVKETQDLRSKWDRIYSVTAFYVGLSDDLGIYEYMEAMDFVFGGEFDLNDLTEENILQIKAKLAEYRAPKIFGGTGDCAIVPPFNPEQADECLEKTKGFRLMGQRFIPDSFMFSNLVFPKASNYIGDKVWTDVFTCVLSNAGLIRGFPRGLDVMALLGSERAKDILVELGDDQYKDYYDKLDELEEEFSQFDETEWNQNLYWSWLFALKSLLKEFGIGYPTFMQTQAWKDKELTTALASWTELRHDTILYAKQSHTPVAYSAYYPPEEKPVVGYIEPVPEFYNRLLALTRMTTNGLDEMEVLDSASKNRLQSLENILTRLLELSKKELKNEELTQADYDFIGDFGKALESTVLGVSNKGAKTVLVADVHTDSNSEQVLEEGVGYVKLMVVAYKVPDGRVLIGAGPVMTYYKFKQPMSKRLSNEMWKDMLDSNPPEEPEWISNFSE
jgi:hypothetical protein